MSYTQRTLDFYNKNAISFIKQTLQVDMSHLHDIFLSYLDQDASILDLGCGSGRDSKVFLEKGYDVTSVDGSNEICMFTSRFLGRQVLNLQFKDIGFVEKFNGIWACASLLHVEKKDLKVVFEKIIKSMKAEGVLYISFKYGDYDSERNGRYFIDFNEKTLKYFISSLNNVMIDKLWVTCDARKDRQDEKWINAIVIKRSV